MEKFKSFYFLLFLSLNACFGTFLLGYYLTVYNSLQTQIEYLLYIGSSSSQKTVYESVITAVIPLGGCVGSFLSSYIFKLFGRKNTLFFTDLVIFMGSLVTLNESLTCIIFGRFICGFGVGINSSLVGLYIKEMSPPELSHYLCSWINISVNLGILMAFLFGLNTPSEEELELGAKSEWWRFMFGFPLIFCSLRSFLIFWKFNFESPLNLLQRNENEEAMRVIKSLYKEESVQEVYEELTKRANTLQQISIKDQESLKQNFVQKHLLAFSVAMSMILANQWSGINALAYYSSKLFEANGWSSSVSNLLNGGFGLTNLFSGLLLVYPLKWLGVRKTYLMSLLCVGISLALISICSFLGSGVGVTVFIYFYDFFFNLGCGPMIFIVIPEILPDLLIGVSFLFFWIYAFIIGLCFPSMLSSDLGVGGSFLLFTFLVLGSFGYNVVYFQTDYQREDIEKSSFIEKESNKESP